MERIKEGVRIFDKDRPTCLATDWSKDGIGYWLFQKHCQCPSQEIFCCQTGWKVTLVGSRFTHQAESRYAPVEGEALAVADALEKARHFVLGCRDLTIAVDHKPLLKLFGDRCLEDIANPRLRNLKEKTLLYRFRMVYIPGVRNLTSDALSRHPSGTRQPTRMALQDDADTPRPSCSSTVTSTNAIGIGSHTPQAANDDEGLALALCAATSTIPISWETLQTATASDRDLTDLIWVIEEGPPLDRNMIPPNIREYHQHMDNLSVIDGVVCLGDRIVIPTALRETCLSALHAAHQGTSGMTARAHSSIFWPKINAAIAQSRNTAQYATATRQARPTCQQLPPSTRSTPSNT